MSPLVTTTRLYSTITKEAEREAEPLFIKALELTQRLLGPEHPHVAASYDTQAYLYYSQGRCSEAEPLYIQALEIAEQSLGVNHPDTITIRNNLQSKRDNWTKHQFS